MGTLAGHCPWNGCDSDYMDDTFSPVQRRYTKKLDKEPAYFKQVLQIIKENPGINLRQLRIKAGFKNEKESTIICTLAVHNKIYLDDNNGIYLLEEVDYAG